MRLFCIRLFYACLIVFLVLNPLEARAASAAPAEHLAVLFLIDDSGSMQVNDPTGRRYAAAALFVAALDAGDRVGALRFASGSQPLTAGLPAVTGEQDKAAWVDRFAPVPAGGYTDVKAAFETARTMIAAQDLRDCRTVAIFLTDGTPEVPDMTAGYRDEALAAARALGVPVYAVALTPAGQTAFLTRLAAETGGRVIPAARADDLIDSYLAILGELKDRTVLRLDGGDIEIDPGLAPYIRTATLIALHPGAEQVRLVAPDGSLAAGGAALGDLRITPVTVASPMPGRWSFEQPGGGAGPVRVILNSRLRARVTAPAGLVEAGQPVTITAELVEEQSPAAQVKIVGEAAFSALATLPDGRQESLDVLYDDGTHGDLTAGDGVFSRQFPNTAQPGAYRVELRGRKGQVPVSAAAQFEAVPIPDLLVEQPGQAFYALRGEPVPLAARLAEAAEDRWQGRLAAKVTAPSGQETVIPLHARSHIFEGGFSPQENGLHQVAFYPVEAAYLGIPYRKTAGAAFTARMIPTVTVVSAQLPLGRARYEPGAARQGIPVEITLRSTSPAVEQITVLPAGVPGFTLREAMPLEVPPGESKRILHLLAEAGIEPGSRRCDLQFQPAGAGHPQAAVDLLDHAGPLDFTIYQPAITLTAEVVSGCLPGRCWQPAPLRVVLRTSSTSLRAEQVSLRLEGIPEAGLQQQVVEIPAGEWETEIEVQSPRPLGAGAYTGTLVLSGAREGVALQPGSALPVQFTVRSLLQSCQTPLILSGSALLAAVMIGIKVARAARAKARPPLVKGTLRHWRKNLPGQPQTVDLTAFKKEGVTIGSGPQCDIIVTGAGLEAEHARISAERDPDGAVRWMLTPLGRVTTGYRGLAAPCELQEQAAYQMGEQVFVFLRDAEL